MKQVVLMDLRARAWTPKGAQEVLYKVELDHTDLQALAQKAAQNKRGVAKAGPITVTITRRAQS